MVATLDYDLQGAEAPIRPHYLFIKDPGKAVVLPFVDENVS
jgi:hypothetical protein